MPPSLSHLEHLVIALLVTDDHGEHGQSACSLLHQALHEALHYNSFVQELGNNFNAALDVRHDLQWREGR